MYIFMPDEGRCCKVGKGVVKIVHKILGNFEVIVQIWQEDFLRFLNTERSGNCELKPSTHSELRGVFKWEESYLRVFERTSQTIP